jgi:hypothetical protein
MYQATSIYMAKVIMNHMFFDNQVQFMRKFINLLNTKQIEDLKSIIVLIHYNQD